MAGWLVSLSDSLTLWRSDCVVLFCLNKKKWVRSLHPNLGSIPALSLRGWAGEKEGILPWRRAGLPRGCRKRTCTPRSPKGEKESKAQTKHPQPFPPRTAALGSICQVRGEGRVDRGLCPAPTLPDSSNPRPPGSAVGAGRTAGGGPGPLRLFKGRVARALLRLHLTSVFSHLLNSPRLKDHTREVPLQPGRGWRTSKRAGLALAGWGGGFALVMASQGNGAELSYSFPSSQTSLPALLP